MSRLCLNITRASVDSRGGDRSCDDIEKNIFWIFLSGFVSTMLVDGSDETGLGFDYSFQIFVYCSYILLVTIIK